MGYVVLVAALVGLPTLMIWFAKRDRKHAEQLGELSSQSSVVIGAEVDIPRILPVEPDEGETLNGALVEDLSHCGNLSGMDENDDQP